MNCLGHIRILPDESRLEQTAAEHCRKTAEYAGECLRGIGLAAPGYLAGLLHDFGKFQSTYQEYLEKAAAGEPVKRGSVIHTFQGCRMLLERYHEETPDRYEDITAELLAFAVGAHHGLFDCVDERRRSGFFHRMTAEGISYKEAVTNFDIFQIDQATLDMALREIEGNMPRFIAVKSGLEEPHYCGVCDYCKSVKKARIRNYSELLEG